MKAVQISECGGTEVLQLVDVPVPERKAGQVLVKSVSVGVNPVDLIVRAGFYKPSAFPKARQQGAEWRGAACVAW